MAQPPGTGVVLSKKIGGLGAPKKPDGSSDESEQNRDSEGNVAWVRFDFAASAGDFFEFQRTVTTALVDSKGKEWPYDEYWTSNSVYLLIPRGYDSVPDKLTARVNLMGREFASMDAPTLPKPKPVTVPGLSKAWDGLRVEACRLLSDAGKTKRLFVDSDLPAGHVLTARLLGTSWTEGYPNLTWGIKGPYPGSFSQIISCMLRYPESADKAFVEVMDLAPKHIRKQLRFRNLPQTEKFGASWFTGPSDEVPFGGDALFRLSGLDHVPSRQPDRPRSVVTLSFESSGLVRNIRTRLISPTSLHSIPMLVQSRTYPVQNVAAAKTPSDWTTGPLEVVLEVEADIFVPVKKAKVAVDLKSPRTVADPVGRVTLPYPILHGFGPHPGFSGFPGQSSLLMR